MCYFFKFILNKGHGHFNRKYGADAGFMQGSEIHSIRQMPGQLKLDLNSYNVHLLNPETE